MTISLTSTGQTVGDNGYSAAPCNYLECGPRAKGYFRSVAQALKPGDSYQIPSGTIHDAKSGAGGAKVLAVHIVRKGEPLATPAK